MTRRAPALLPPVSLLVDPLAWIAISVMVVNDRWLKAAWHDSLTGKLSDVAICFFLPLFLAEIGTPFARRVGSRAVLGVAAVLAALLFTCLELSPLASAWTCDRLAEVGPWLGIRGPFVMTRDPGDLWALLMTPLAVAWGESRIRAHERREVELVAP